MKFVRVSPLTGIEHQREIPCTPEQLTRWQAGHRCIQDVMPNLTDGQREFIMSGITEEEWDTYIRSKGDEG